MTKQRSWLCWIGLFLAASPAVVPFFLVILYGVDVHFWDEWDPTLAGLYIKAHQHQLTFTDLISQHNEHRLFIPRLIYFAINSLTNWNNLANLWTGWILACLASAAILFLIRRTTTPARLLVIWFLCNLLIFTPAQSENWLWGIGVANLLPMTLFAAAVAVAASPANSWLKFLPCLLFASAATFTNGNGFFCWPLVGAILFWSQSREEFSKKKWLLAAWISAFALNAGLYFYHYSKPEVVGNYYSTRPLSVMMYFLTFAGNAFAYSTTYPWQLACTVLGGTMLVIYFASAVYFVDCWRKGKSELSTSMLIWLAIGGFSVLSAAIAALCRAGYGPQQAINSRYVTHSLFLPGALINLIPLMCDDLRTRLGGRLNLLWNQLPIGLATAIVFIQISTMPSAFSGSRGWRIFQRQLKADLLLINILPDNPQLAKLFPVPSTLKTEANALNRMGYLRPPLINSDNANTIQATDTTNARGQLQTVTAPSPGSIRATGWAVFNNPAQAADAVFLAYQDPNDHPIIFAIADIGAPRDDIATQLNDPRYLNSGWQATFPLTQLPTNLKTVRVSAWALNADTGKAFPLDGVIVLNR